MGEQSLHACRYPWQPSERLAAKAILEDMGVVSGHAGEHLGLTLVPSMSRS